MAQHGHPHGFGERYDLPVPMSWVIACACLVIAFTFLISAMGSASPMLNRLFSSAYTKSFDMEPDKRTSLTYRLMATCSSFLLLLCFTTATWGSQDALMNFSPTFIWIIWWIGCSISVVLFGNFWPFIDPWRNLYEFIGFLGNRLHLPHVVQHTSANQRSKFFYPSFLGLWLGVIGLLTWCGLEIIYPIASMPRQVSLYIAAYSLWNWLGMWTFGIEEWCLKADAFSIYFRYLASWRDFFHLSNNQSQVFLASQDTHQGANKNNFNLSQIGFVIAMIASVLFDGLHASSAWLWFESALNRWGVLSHDVNGYSTGILGLLLIWLLFLTIYLVICQFTLWISFLFPKKQSDAVTVKAPNSLNFLSTGHVFLKSLLPIAFAYLIAHNFSSLFIQGQNIIELISDPFGRMWNLFGTASFYPDITLIDAKVTWYVATFSIVMGHIVSVLMGHQAAVSLSELTGRKIRPHCIWVLNLPMTLMMMAFTALSLSIIAEPLTFIAG